MIEEYIPTALSELTEEKLEEVVVVEMLLDILEKYNIDFYYESFLYL